MKVIPPEFYLPSEHESLVYTDNPPGRFCLERFLNGEAPWENQQLQSDNNRQQKTLILHDWSFPVWDSLKMHEVVNELKQLLNAGFKLYHYAFNEFQELTDHSVHALLSAHFYNDLLHYSFAENQQVLTEATVHFNLPLTSLYVLDYHAINYMVHAPQKSLSDYLSQEIIYLNDYANIKKSFPSFQPLKVNNMCINEKIKNPDFVKLEESIKNQMNHFVYEAIDHFVADGNPELDTLWNYPDKPAIKSITLKNCDDFNSRWLQHLNEFTSLEELMFISVDVKVDHEDTVNVKLSNLKRLSCINSNIALYAILNISPSLKILEIDSFQLGDSFLSALPSLSLWELSIEDSLNKNNLSGLLPFLKNQTNLVKLTICDINIKYHKLKDALPASLKLLTYTENNRYAAAKSPNHQNINLFEFKIIIYTGSTSNEYTEQVDITWFNEDHALIGYLKEGNNFLIEPNKTTCHSLSVFQAESVSTKFLKEALTKYPNIKRLHLANLKETSPLTDIGIINATHLYLNNMDSEVVSRIIESAPKTLYLTLNNSKLSIDKNNSKHITPYIKRFTIGLNSNVLVKNKLNWPDLKVLEIGNAQVNQVSIENIVANAASPIIIDLSLPTNMKNKKLDANTAFDSNNIKEYCIDKQLYPMNGAPDISVDYLRKTVYAGIELNPKACAENSAFTLLRYHELKLISHPMIVSPVDLYAKMLEQNNSDYAYGKQVFILNNDWLPIVSSSAHDEMLEYHIKEIDVSIEIKYSTTESLYYIKNKEKKDKGKRVTLDFIIKRNLNKAITSSNNKLTKWVKEIEEYFSEFQKTALQLDPNKSYTGKDYLDEMFKQKVGACRHRAVLFYFLLKEKFANAPCRIIFNDIHVYVEVFDTDWIMIDLGGYPADIKINNDLPELQPSPENAKIDEYVNHLSLQRNSEPPTNSVNFLQTIINGFHQKILIECESSLNLSSLALAIEKSCHESSLPVFYIHTPSDLNCRRPWLENINNIGILHTEPGGVLYDFIHQQHQQTPVFIINTEKFKKMDFVKFNSILDKQRKISGFSIPPHAIVIVLNNINHPDCYKGSDLYSRFDKIYRNPFKNSLDHTFNLPWVPLNENERHLVETVNLFNGADWKRQLLGEWTLQGNHFIFKTGKLLPAMHSGKLLHIQNGPWHDPEFVYFCKQALMRGYIDIAGSKIRILPNQCIAISEGYADLSLDIPMINAGFSPSGFVLNASTAHRFFSSYYIDSASKSFQVSAGIIEQHAGLELHINFTHAIPYDLAMRLLAFCQEKKVSVHLHQLSAEVDKFPNIQLIHTNYILTAINELKKLKHPIILDISECNFSDLMLHTEVKLNQTKLEFSETKKALLLAIENQQDVVLAGEFNAGLAQSLASLLLEQRCGYYGRSRIILITTDITHLTFLPIQTQFYSVQPKVFPKVLQSIPPVIKDESSDEFIRHRYEQVNNVLSKSPFVFIAGLTGVGKSQFIQEQFADARSELYFGEEAMVAWAKDTSNKRKILVIDEANLSPRQWSEFHGLLYKPRGILINGIFYPLKNRHKVVFIGNPASYGDRQAPPTFINEDNVVVFDLMPLSYISKNILMPLLPPSAIAPLLEVYQKICEQAKNEILISPRELRLMASFALHAQHRNPAIDLDKAAKYYAYTIGNLIIPDLFPTPEPFMLPNVIKLPAESGFLLTASRLPIWQMLSDLLAQRHFNSGIGGLIIEGESGIGKSELVKACLDALHTDMSFTYYFIPANMDLADKEKLLLKAFHEGAIVVMDEINASSMMERLLNSLLMGQTLEGEKAKQSGFLLIGTQNPCYFGGRNKQSNALSRRLLTLHMSPYPKEEIQQILEHQGVKSEKARLISIAYDRLSPRPTLRDLEKLAQKKVVSSKKRKAELSNWALLFSAVGDNDFIGGTALENKKNGP